LNNKPFKLAISGTRLATDRNLALIFRALLNARLAFNINGTHQLVVGDARGVDQIATANSPAWGFQPVIYVADWDKFGKGAGDRRNALMATDADALVALPANNAPSKGTRNCIDKFIDLGKPVLIFPISVAEKQTTLFEEKKHHA